MKTTIDRAGRIVIPKQVRDSLGLIAGAELDVTVRNGVLEIEPASTPMRLERTGSHVVAVPEEELPPLTADEVRATLEQIRR